MFLKRWFQSLFPAAGASSNVRPPDAAPLLDIKPASGEADDASSESAQGSGLQEWEPPEDIFRTLSEFWEKQLTLATEAAGRVTDRTSLEVELRRIDWEGLADAYGPSNETPDQLLELVSDSSERRLAAIDALAGTICHQGTIYPASVVAVPFLAAMLRTESWPPAASKELAIKMLSHLAAGGAYYTMHAPIMEKIDNRKAEPEYQQILRDEAVLLAAMKRMVRGYAPLFVAALTHAAPAVRAHAAAILGRLREPSTESALIAMANHESHDKVKAVAAIALGCFSSPEARACITRVAREEKGPLAWLAAGAAMLAAPEATWDQAAVDRLRRVAMEDTGAASDAYEDLMDLDAFERDLVMPLAKADPTFAANVLSAVIDRVDRPHPQHESLSALLAIARLAGPTPGEWWPLTPGQRRAIRVVAAQALSGGTTPAFYDSNVLKSHGLPTDRQALLPYL